MFGILRRGLAVLLLAVLVAACQIIPGGGRGPEPSAPVPQPSEETPEIGPALPTDTDRHRIALLVPLSGENAEVGQSIANATTMALLDTNASNLRITTYDTASGAAEAAERAVADGNQLILGPLVRDAVDDVLAEARAAGVPLISFSNDISVAEPDAFVMGLAPGQSIGRTVEYAVERGARRFSALAPNGEYGQRALDALQAALEGSGASLVATERYDRGNTSIISAAERLKARGDFDTVLIADGARLSILAAGALRDQDSATPTIVGPELWGGEDEVTRAQALRGAWFSSVSDDRFRQFATSYETRFGARPYRIATLGYDAVLLALRVARNWPAGEVFPKRELLDEGGFLGIDGPFRFLPTGVAERAMEVRQVGNGTVTVVSPAPTRFE